MDESIEESMRADEVRQSLIIDDADMSDDDDDGVRYSDDRVQSIEDDIIELSIIEELSIMDELSIIDDELL